MRVVEIDRLNAETLERGVAGLGDVGRAVVDPAFVLAGLPHDAELGGHDQLAPPFQEAAEQGLVMAEAIGVRRVEEGDAQLHGARERRQGHSVVGRPVEFRHAHAAQPDFRHADAAFTQLAFLHNLLLRAACQKPAHAVINYTV